MVLFTSPQQIIFPSSLHNILSLCNVTRVWYELISACAKFFRHYCCTIRWLVRAILCSYNRASTSIDLPLPSRFHFHRPSTSILLPSILHLMEPHPRKQMAWVWLLRTNMKLPRATVAEKGHPILPLRTNFHTSIHQLPSIDFHPSIILDFNPAASVLPNFSTSKVPPFDSRTLLINVHAQKISRVSRSWQALKVPMTH